MHIPEKVIKKAIRLLKEYAKAVRRIYDLNSYPIQLELDEVLSALMDATTPVGPFRVEAHRTPLGETGDYDSWLELVTPTFNLQCHDPNVGKEQLEELAELLNNANAKEQECADLWIAMNDAYSHVLDISNILLKNTLSKHTT